MNSRSLKVRIRSRERLLGTFVKTSSHQVVEILGASGLDFVVIDAEHAPFDRTALDLLALAARASSVPALVRLAATSPNEALNVLDIGFTGIIAPHATEKAGVERLISACRYRKGTRGFSNSPRAGGYGSVAMKPHLDRSDSDAVIVFQIEDREAIDRLPELISIEEVDCFLIGRADLAVSFEAYDTAHPDVTNAVDATIRACVSANKAVGIFVADPIEIPAFVEKGVSLFIVGSDQAMLRAQASATRQRFAEVR